MRVLLDNHPSSIDTETVGEALASAAAIAREQGRVIVTITVDGDLWDDEQLGSEEHFTRSAEQIDLETADLRALVVLTVNDARNAMGRLADLQRDAAERLQTDEAATAMNSLQHALELWLAVHDTVLKASEALELDLDTFRAGPEPAIASIERLQQHLTTLRSALADQDPVGISDVLLYELPEAVGDWTELLDALRDAAEGAR